MFVDRVLYGGPDQQRFALGALAASTAVGALVSGFAVRFLSLRLVTLVGLVLSAGSLVWMARWTPQVDLGEVALALGIFGLGFGLTVTPRSTAAVEVAGRASFGMASATVTVARMIGMAIGVAVLTAYGSTTIDRLYDELFAVPDGWKQVIPAELRDRPLRDGLVVEALERWAATEASSILVGLFVAAGVVTLVAIPPGLALGIARVCWRPTAPPVARRSPEGRIRMEATSGDPRPPSDATRRQDHRLAPVRHDRDRRSRGAARRSSPTPTRGSGSTPSIRPPSIVRPIAAALGLHPLIAEDIVERNQRAKVETFDDIVHIVLFELSYRGDVQTAEIDFVLGPRFLLSVHGPECDLRSIGPMRAGVEPILKKGTDFLLYVLADHVVDGYFPVLDRLAEEIDELQDRVLESPSDWTLQRLFVLKRELLAIRRATSPAREIFNQLTNREVAAVDGVARRLLPRRLRPPDPGHRRAGQLPGARRRHARHLPLDDQQQPVADHEAPDRCHGHPGRDRGRRRASSG